MKDFLTSDGLLQDVIVALFFGLFWSIAPTIAFLVIAVLCIDKKMNPVHLLWSGILTAASILLDVYIAVCALDGVQYGVLQYLAITVLVAACIMVFMHMTQSRPGHTAC